MARALGDESADFTTAAAETEVPDEEMKSLSGEHGMEAIESQG
jgi:hypothetical protein